MKVILTNSRIEMREAIPSGTEVEFFPDFVNSDHPTSGGWYISNSGSFSQSSMWEGKSGVSDVIPVLGYSKVKVTGAKGNAYTAVAAFYSSADDATGTSPLVIASAGDGEINIPEDASFVRFGVSLSSGGTVATNCKYFMVAQ